MIGARVRALLDEERPTLLLGFARVALATLLLMNTQRLADELDRNGYFAHYFFMPVVPESWVPSASTYALLLGLKAAGALLALIGVVPRAGLFSAAAIGLYLLACDRLQYHNNRYSTHLIALLIALTPCHQSFNLWQLIWRRAREARGPYWAVRLAQLQVSLIYLASGVGKLFDADWRGGQVMHLRFLSASRRASGVIAELLASPLFGSLASKAAIATEIFVAIGLWLPRTRPLAFFMGIVFHLGIQASARVDLFSWLMLSSYMLFVTPELRERRVQYDPSDARARAIASLVAALDWFRRFAREAVPGASARGKSLRVFDRDGGERTGLDLVVTLFRALPLLFPLWLPLWILARFRRPRAAVAPITPDAPQRS